MQVETRNLTVVIVSAIVGIVVGTAAGVAILNMIFAPPAAVPSSEAASNHVAAPVVPAVPTTSPTKVPVYRSSDSPEMQEALSYLRSDGRVAKYESIVPKAGIKIAKALDAGTFGPVKRYDDWKKPLQPGYAGWGGISSVDNGLFAWVYWNANGTIDYSKPITQIAVDNAAQGKLGVVSTFGPSSTDEKADRGTYWETYLAASKEKTIVICTSGIQSPDTAKTGEHFEYPTSISEIMDLDALAFKKIESNMDARFGPGWDN